MKTKWLNVKQVQNEALLTIYFIRVPCLIYSSTLKLEAKRSSETSYDFQRTIPPYIAKYITLRNKITFGNIRPRYIDWGNDISHLKYLPYF